MWKDKSRVLTSPPLWLLYKFSNSELAMCLMRSFCAQSTLEGTEMYEVYLNEAVPWFHKIPELMHQNEISPSKGNSLQNLHDTVFLQNFSGSLMMAWTSWAHMNAWKLRITVLKSDLPEYYLMFTMDQTLCMFFTYIILFQLHNKLHWKVGSVSISILL